MQNRLEDIVAFNGSLDLKARFTAEGSYGAVAAGKAGQQVGPCTLVHFAVPAGAVANGFPGVGGMGPPVGIPAAPPPVREVRHDGAKMQGFMALTAAVAPAVRPVGGQQPVVSGALPPLGGIRSPTRPRAGAPGDSPGGAFTAPAGLSPSAANSGIAGAPVSAAAAAGCWTTSEGPAGAKGRMRGRPNSRSSGRVVGAAQGGGP
mmetsp:Transcript_31323/g.90459  ORF Transcript_31323/g.90459 Transcript_31323/m.90459 type:complete len:204 (+) Transcript_31323:2-613(+)